MKKPNKKDNFELKNYYELIPKKYTMGSGINNPYKHIHGLNLPLRMVIVGSSGSGKTNSLLNLINHIGCFEYIHIITKSIDGDPLYEYLQDKFKDTINISEGIDTIPDLDTFDKTMNNLVVIDDLILERDQKVIEEFFIRCRKKGVSVIYLSQSWFKIPITIRQNLNYIIIKKFGSTKDITALCRDYSFGLDTDELKQIYRFCVNADFKNFMLIDLNANDDDKFRKNFTPIKIEKD